MNNIGDSNNKIIVKISLNIRKYYISTSRNYANFVIKKKNFFHKNCLKKKK